MPDKRFVLLVNPRGGTRRGPAILEQVKPVLAAGGAALDVHWTEYSGHARRIARTLDLAGYDGFCLIGGDGTIQEVAEGLLQRGEPVTTAIGAIPGGTGNTLLEHLGCSSPMEAARRILAGRTCPLDAVRLTMGTEVVYCVNLIGWGAVADINHTAERLRLLGPPRYAVAALWHILRARRRKARLILDGRAIEDEFTFVIACNTRFTGSGMMVAPRAEIDDGKIDVVVLRKVSRWRMFKVLAKVFDGSHVDLNCIGYYQVRSFAIESEGHEPLDIDGEIKGTAPVSGEMMPGALRVFA